MLALQLAGHAADKGRRTPQEVFDGMRTDFVVKESKGVHASFQWHISGRDGGNWYVKVNDGTCEIAKGEVPHPDVTFVVNDKDWVAISNGKLNGTYADLTGRLKISGSFSLARKLGKMFP